MSNGKKKEKCVERGKKIQDKSFGRRFDQVKAKEHQPATCGMADVESVGQKREGEGEEQGNHGTWKHGNKREPGKHGSMGP